uniref:30S ribosomal protein 11 n=1 Tax=Spongospora subterranea TaxID=70186 RepID=A0A096XTV8_9EUKA|nr:30S ribosomal protein 11 [Spongospora subterranea]AIK19914.1 30S ribosomal protein 11 [Spongospora subterranea]
MLSNNLDFFSTNSVTHTFKKVQELFSALQYKVYFLTIRSTLNNFYITLTNNFGQIIVVRSGGTLKSSSKKNTSYNLELILLEIFKIFAKLQIQYILLKIDFMILKKKIITKILQKFNIKIIGIQLNSFPSFNGIRAKKKRRI